MTHYQTLVPCLQRRDNREALSNPRMRSAHAAQKERSDPDPVVAGNGPHAVELERVTKTFGQHVAVDDLSLHVPRGSIYGFIGPNGAGKTTTLRMILNIVPARLRARARVRGAGPGHRAIPRIGYLPEERGLYRRMKVRELLCFFGQLKTGRRCGARWTIGWGASSLTDWANKRVEALSKGMAQKIQFIVAALGEPALLILDEPFSGLDPVNLDVLRRAVLDSADPGCHDHLQHPRHGGGGADVRFHLHDLPGPEGARWHPRFDPGPVRRGHHSRPGRRGRVGAGRVAGVERVEDFGQMQELRLRAGTDPQTVLAGLVGRSRVSSFEVARPSLHDIFVRIAGPAAKEVPHA